MNYCAAMAQAVTLETIRTSCKNIYHYATKLPDSVPLAPPDDDIHRIMTSVFGDDPWHTFNRRFDALYMDHMRTDRGFLLNIRRGEFGMVSVAKYLAEVPWSTDMPLDLAHIKLSRVLQSMEKIL